jgi:predicted metal-dependent phosphoesterase TrpH
VGGAVLKVDLHLHSREDPIDNITHDARALIDRAARLGFDAIAITLHDGLLRDGSAAAYARELGIVLIPGIERSIDGRHVLLINFPDRVQDVRSFDDAARLKARTGGLVIAPHPFFPDRTCLRSALDVHADLFDAVEWSYFWTRGLNFNTRAARWARQRGKPIVGNSDLHDLRQLGRTYSLVESDRHPDAICAAIREGRVTVETEPVPALELTQVLTGMLLRGRKRRNESLIPNPLSSNP